MLSSGTVSRFWVLPAAVTAATAVDPSTLTALCITTLPMAVMLHCNPMGRPMAHRRRQIARSKRASPGCIFSIVNRRRMYTKLATPDTACERSVATAAPSTPMSNWMIKYRSSPTLSKLVSTKKYSGVLLSPSARMMALVMLYRNTNGMPAKMQPMYRQASSKISAGVCISCMMGRVSATVATVSTPPNPRHSQAALATLRRMAGRSRAPNCCAMGMANPLQMPVQKPMIR